MSSEDWYRKKTWKETDQKSFFERLKRSRSAYNKAQYVRIQASYLATNGAPEMISHSIRLLDLMLDKWPEESELAMAYLQKAKCFEKLNKIEHAIDSYQDCFKAQRKSKNAKTMAHLDFFIFVIENEINELLIEANKILDEFTDMLLFQSDIFIYSLSKAIFYHKQGDSERSKIFSLKAKEAATKNKSGFRYHQNAGLVKNISPKLNKYLALILNEDII